MMGGPPPPRMGGGGGGRSPFTNTLLLTNMPAFFVGYQQVRDWLYPCGTAKTCLFYPRAKKKDGGGGGGEEEGEAKEEDDTSDKPKTILVNMLNPDQALKVVASFPQFSGQLDDRYKDIRCYLVPASPDIPLPPPLMDETSKKVLGDKLWNNFVGLETSFSERDNTDTTTTTSTGVKKEESSQAKPSDTTNTNAAAAAATGNEPKLLDADKVAAAAGGAYDADEDPLNAPQVLEAVKEFRRKLDKTHGSQKTQRMELVAKKLKELRPRIRARVQAEKAGRLNPQQQQQQAPPPPQPNLPPPGPPPGLPPPPRAAAAAAADSGKRGRSNLPAWMTQQQQQQQATTAAEEPSAKKLKTESSYPSDFPSNLPATCHATLRQFLANQVKESMGEEEATLIDFLYTHILQGKATDELLQELKVVLEEEADAFLKAVWSKVQELQKS